MFTNILSNVAIMLVYMLLGFLLCKGKSATASHAKSMSALLLFVLSPCMIVNSFLQMEYSTETLGKIAIYFGVTLVIQGLFLLVLYMVFRRKYDDAKYRILSAAATLGNVGFLGLPVISSIFPTEPIVACYSSINVMSMNLLVFTIGVFMITNNKKYISVKSAIVNPTSLSVLASIPLFIFSVQFPTTINNSIVLMAKMVTPMCMFILGMRLSTANMKALFTRPFVYATCIFKLIAFPVFAFLCVRWLPFMDNVAKTAVFVLAATPTGAVIQSLSELHECEQELSANVVLLTTILSVITMPVVLTILQGII